MSTEPRDNPIYFYGKTEENSPTFGLRHSEKSIEKMRKAQGGENHWNHGKTTPPEVRQKISDSLKGKPSPMKGKTPWNKGKIIGDKEKHWNFGKTTSPETREKISNSSKGRVPWNKGKKSIDWSSSSQEPLFKDIPV